MKALILAAGRGTRIQAVHGNHPKCLISVDGVATILDHQIRSLFEVGIQEIGIVVGYEKGQIIRHVVNTYPDRLGDFTFIPNTAFARTNNIYSFWLGQRWVDGDPFICLNADVVFDPRALLPALRSSAPINMIVDPEWRDETMKVIVEGDRVVRMNKRITKSEFSGTYIGVTSFNSEVQDRLYAKIQSLIRSGRENEFFNVAVQELADEGLHVGHTSTANLPWAEIDDANDLAWAQSHVFPSLYAMPLAA
jgi:choline kinase